MAATIHPINGPIPGEAWTVEPGKYPYERPPQFTDIPSAFNFVFKKIMQDEVATHLLSLLELGVPVSTIAEYLAEAGASEGYWAIPMAINVSIPIAVLLVAMAKAAGIEYKLSPQEGGTTEISDAMVEVAYRKVDAGKVDVAQEAATKAAPGIREQASKPQKGFITPKAKGGY